VVLVIAAVAIFAATFDPNRYKGEIERLAKEKTGRTLSIKGDIKMASGPASAPTSPASACRRKGRPGVRRASTRCTPRSS
jgi:AsmA protein